MIQPCSRMHSRLNIVRILSDLQQMTHYCNFQAAHLYSDNATIDKGNQKGHTISAERPLLKRKNSERDGRPSQPQYTETASDEEVGMDLPTPSKAWKMSKRPRRQLDWLADADVETRKAYGSYLMSGHGTPFSLFDL